MDIAPEPGAPLHQPAPAAVAEFVPAGFWIRAGAYMIDGILLAVAQLVVFGLLFLVGIPKIATNLCSSLLGIGYFIWMPAANSGQTLGKMAAGIAIVRMDGSPLTYLRCLGRWAGYLVSTVVAGLGFVIAAFTGQKRALHDYLADTRVIYIQEIGTGRKAAVILMGLVLPLVAMLGIIAAVAIPRFADLTRKSGEGAGKGNLGSLRSAITIYYADMEGQYPADISALTLNGKYLQQIPDAKTPNFHPDSPAVRVYDASVCSGKAVDLTKLQDTGGWGYVADPKAPCSSSLFVNCTHTDSRQKQWASY